MFSEFVDVGLGEGDGHEVGFREVAVVVGVLLGAHEVGFAVVVVPSAGFLPEGCSGIEEFGLADDFVTNGAVNGAEAVEIFDLDLGAELLLSPGSEGDIDIAAELSFFHVAIADSGVLHDFLKGGEVGVGLVGGAHIGFADAFHERNAGAVVIDAAVFAEVVKFCHVLLEVDAGKSDKLIGEGIAGETGSADGDFAGGAEGEVVL